MIFATTAWHVLPSVCKQGDYGPGGSGLFFGASRAAEKYFKIGADRTGLLYSGQRVLFLTILGCWNISGRWVRRLFLKEKTVTVSCWGRQYSHLASSFFQNQKISAAMSIPCLPVGNDGRMCFLMEC